MSKTAIVIFSDPKTGTEESLSRLLNGLSAAYDFKSAGKEVKIIFQGTGTRWPEALQNEKQPGYKVFQEVKDKVQGISSACADVFGAKPVGFDLISEFQMAGTSGVPSFVKLQEEGYTILIF